MLPNNDESKKINMSQYENALINDLTKNAPPAKEEETREGIEQKIKQTKKSLKEAKFDGKERLIKKYQKELDDLEAKLALMTILPEDKIEVDLKTGQDEKNEDEPMPEQNDELSKYWHYKVMHTAFSGEDSINLTLDDSDQSVFDFRKAFIKDHCENYSDEVTKIELKKENEKKKNDGPIIEMENEQNKEKKKKKKRNNDKENVECLNIPTAIWNSLFPHQRSALEWLWGLWNDKKGGIEGDEMGLGKTAIVCTFLHALIFSRLLNKPSLILCPLTVAQQWIRELHIWCPMVKAILLHSTRTNNKESNKDILSAVEGTTTIIVSNYETLHKSNEEVPLSVIEWGVVVCDEGHKIRNSKSRITRLVKHLLADFRLAVSGSPIQNSLVELWSIFDFAIPGLLGALDVFENEFAEPIKSGGYANASPFQVFRAYSSAVALRDLIKPYLLRRLKKDVSANLPGKQEQIFFVGLTQQQTNAYLNFADSTLCKSILNGSGEFFVGIDYLRKLCNHPNMAEPDTFSEDIENSAKLILLKKLLPKWNQKKHRVLLFSQYLKMLDFIGNLCDDLGLTYFRLDGDTAIDKRQKLMDAFNAGEKFACLSSTKVGGVGVNLIGADRVVIVDPDWNPSTDNQALERAWRIGQTKNVAVYRLITTGTIEEKMYKKQIFKQFLSNKILQNPSQRRLFVPDSAWDLFQLDAGGMSELQESEGFKKEEFKSEQAEKAKNDDNENNNNNEINNNDNNNDNNDGDKEITQSLFEDGDITSVFHHDELFSGKKTPETELMRIRAARQAKDSLKKLGKSKKRDSAALLNKIKSSADSSGMINSIQEDLIDCFKRHHGKLSTDYILNHFKDKAKMPNFPCALKAVLRKVAVLSKRTHTWHSMMKFM